MFQFLTSYGINYLHQQASYSLDRVLNKPIQVHVSITNACAARCEMCDIWKLPVHDELSADEWIGVLDKMRDWLGPFWLAIAGGEPFQKPGIFDVLKYCRAVGIKTKVSSNGLLLSPKYRQNVLQYGPDFLSFSIDSIHSEIHNKLRGTPHLHSRCVEALTDLRQRSEKIVLGMTTIIMEDNYQDLPDMVNWALELGVDRVLFQPLQPNFGTTEHDRDWYKTSPHWVKNVAVFGDVVDKLSAMRRTGIPIWNSEEQLKIFQAYFENPYTHPRPEECMVRYNMFNIDPHGNVSFCWTVDDIVGNVRNQHPRDIWFSKKATSVREKMKGCHAPCTLNCYRSRSLGELVKLFRFLGNRHALDLPDKRLR